MTTPFIDATFGPERLDGALGDPDALEPEPDTRTFEQFRVTALLVAHDGERWLPETLAALAAQERPPQLVLAVDTGSTDGTPQLLAAALGSSAVLAQPRDTGFGAAVAHAVDSLAGAVTHTTGPSSGVVDWLWLLHDDSAPDPTALRALLAVADASPSVAIVGPKAVGWVDRRRLVEMGLSIAGSGRRETGIERDEMDQGQHDGQRDVLAVGSAGMLVRRDVWDSLGGFDPALAMFREDVDLGWRANLAGHRVVVTSDAVIRHRVASSAGRRRPDAVGGRVHRADRRSALHVLLANAAALAVVPQYLRLALGSLLRALGLVLAKAPGEALEELEAAASVLLRPAAVRRARRARRDTRAVPARAVRPLLAPPWSGARHGIETLRGLAAGRTLVSTSAGSVLEPGPVSDELDEMATGSGWLRALLSRPGTVVLLGLLALALVAFRGLVLGGGPLSGGALLPAPGGASDLWAAYLAGWHDVGTGSGLAAPPYLAPVALLATVLLGKAWLAVDLLLLLAVPLAGLAAYLVLGRLVRARWARVAGAVGYALLPAVTGAVAGGRLGVATAAWLLPLTGWAVLRALGVGRAARPSWGAAWGAGLLLAVLTAFAPVLWPLTVLAGAGLLLLGAPRLGWARLGVVAIVPPVLLLPWSLRALHEPALWVLDVGATRVGTGSPTAWSVALANPGGPGTPVWWVTGGLLLAAWAALLRGDRRRAGLGAWVVALVGLGAGLVLSLLRVTPAPLGVEVPVWPGAATLLGGAALVAAAVLGAEGLRERLAGHHFGWRQPVAVVLLVAAVAAPVLLAGGWLARGAGDGVLARGAGDVLPAYVVASSQTPSRPRTLVVAVDTDGRASYALVAGPGRVVGDADVAPPASTVAALGPVLADVLGGRADEQAVAAMAGYGVGFLEVADPAPDRVVRAVDGVPGLARVGAVQGAAVWRLLQDGPRVRIERPAAADVPVKADATAATTTVDTPVIGGAAGRTLVLAESADPGWWATLDGTALTRAAAFDGWAQAFTLPAGGGRLQVGHREAQRVGWLVAQGVLFVAVVVLATPGRRRPTEDDA